MKRLALILVAALALSGCAGFGKSILGGGTSVTASIENPVTKERQAAVEAGYNVVAAAALTYSRLPRCKAAAPVSVTNLCSSWSVVQKMMKSDAIVYKQLTNLRTFMDNNDTVNAISAFNAAQSALIDLKATAYINGVTN